MSQIDILKTLPISAWPYPKVLVGIPMERTLPYADLLFWRYMEIAMQGPTFIRDLEYSGRIDVVRNNMVKRLLMSDFTHLLMLDLDHKHPADIIQRLSYWVVEHPEVRVVSGLNFRRKKPFDPVAGVYGENGQRLVMLEWDKGLVRVDEMGGASLLVHRSVFEEMEPPWFFNIYDEVWRNSWPGEDIGFCRKCQELNIPIYIDTTVSSPHCTEGLVTEQTYRQYYANHPQEFKDAH